MPHPQPHRVLRRIGHLLVVLGLVGCTLSTGASQPKQASTAALFAPGEVIALVPDRRAAARVRQRGAAAGFTLLEEVPLAALNLHMLRFSYAAPYEGPSAIAALEAADAVVTAGINHAYRVAALPGKSQFDYADALIQWPEGGCRGAVPIGLLDTDLDPQRFAAAETAIVAKSFVRGNDAPPTHGSDVAAVLLNPERLPGARLFSAAVVEGSGRQSGMAGVDSLIEGLDWLAGQGVKVVNISLSGPYNKLLDRSLKTAAQQGMVLVAAVGNDGPEAAPQFPAALDEVIAVTAVDGNREVYRKAVQGAHVDIAAPGVDIAIPNAKSLHFVTGTSIAAPFVTARIASDPQLAGQPVAVIRQVLSQTAEDLGPEGRDDIYGHGLLRAPSVCRK
ncbi:S8 family serine peptidase [Arenibacterium sp. LLYu02]|uniref:S8 family serine peptidase n=1 Tax=Arenibacterium sp. LLYu02 TaxID=3404132 RepID=UPI003B212D04